MTSLLKPLNRQIRNAVHLESYLKKMIPFTPEQFLMLLN